MRNPPRTRERTLCLFSRVLRMRRFRGDSRVLGDDLRGVNNFGVHHDSLEVVFQDSSGVFRSLGLPERSQTGRRVMRNPDLSPCPIEVLTVDEGHETQCSRMNTASK